MSKICKLHDDGLPFFLRERINQGGGDNLKTITDWGKECGRTYDAVEQALIVLRKRGHEFHPYEGKILVKGVQRTGIVIDINKSAEWAISGLNTYEDKQAISRMESTFRIIESGIKNHPQNLPYYEDRLEMMLEGTIARRKIIRKAQKEQGL